MACAPSWPWSATEARGGTDRAREGGVDAGRRVRCTGTSPLMNAPGMCERFYVRRRHRHRRRRLLVYLHYRHHPRIAAAAAATLAAHQLSLPHPFRSPPTDVFCTSSLLLSFSCYPSLAILLSICPSHPSSFYFTRSCSLALPVSLFLSVSVARAVSPLPSRRTESG